MTTMFRTGVRSLLALALLAPVAPGTAAEGAVPAPAGRADLQRVLTQRIAKAYCQMGLGVVPGESTRQLLESVALFDLQMSKLRQSPLSARERESLAAMEQAWGPFRAVAMERVTRPGCETIARQSEDLLRATNDFAREIRGRTGTQSAAGLGSISGRQQVLAQKLAKLYMARAWGLDSVAMREEIDSARNEFSGALAKLQGAPENTAAEKETLKRVGLQWVWLDTALEQQGVPSYGLVVADASESITQGMEAVTRMYQGAPASRDRPGVGLPSNGDAPSETAATEQVRLARSAVAGRNRN